MRTPNRILLGLLLLAGIAACSDDNAGTAVPLRCGQGFQAIDGECVPVRDTGIADDTGVEPDGTDDVTPEPDGDDDTSDDTGVDATDDAGDCADDAQRCSALGVPQICTFGTWVDQAPCGPGLICTGGRCVAGADCTPGEVRGCFSTTEQRICNDAGDNFDAVACPDDLFCFRGECGTQICEPGQTSCDEDARWVLQCAPSGEEWVRSEECNPRDDLVCNLGECVSGCAAALKNPAYIGCEYWSVDLPQFQDPFGDPRAIPHAVVVANTGDRAADITIETRSGIPLVTSATRVAPGAVETILFPRADVEDTRRSMNSFRIQTSEPVVAYQFNPLNDVGVASNDASLLLPANAIGREYYVMSWPSGIDALGFGAQTGWFTVVATNDGETDVTITFSSALIDGPDADLNGVTAGETRTFTMQQWEVLNFEAKSTLFAPGDLTGSHIVADRPIVVFGGHEEAVIGEDGDEGSNCCADHMEQQLFPVSTWGTRYLAVHSPPRGTEPDYWRVMASENGTRITTTPSIPELDGRTLNAGEFAEGRTTESFEVFGSAPILVAQFIVSQQSAGVERTRGDPAFVLAVPVEQMRADYAVLTPADYNDDYITVMRPVGAEVRVDGVAVPDGDFQSFGTGEYERAYVEVEPGPHFVESPDETPFAVTMWGYDTAVSYGYPGGLNLATEFEFEEP